jgi:hypothetical protein
VFTARYALSPYIKQISLVFKGLNKQLFASEQRQCSMTLEKFNPHWFVWRHVDIVGALRQSSICSLYQDLMHVNNHIGALWIWGWCMCEHTRTFRRVRNLAAASEYGAGCNWHAQVSCTVCCWRLARFFRLVCKLAKCLLVSSCLPVCLSVCLSVWPSARME